MTRRQKHMSIEADAILKRETDHAWRIEVYNPNQEEWNLYSAIRLAPKMYGLTVDEGMSILRSRDSYYSTTDTPTIVYHPKTLRLRNVVSGDILMWDLLR